MSVMCAISPSPVSRAPCPTSNVMLYCFASDVFLSYVTLLTHLIRIPVPSMITVLFLLAHMCTRSPCFPHFLAFVIWHLASGTRHLLEFRYLYLSHIVNVHI